MLVAALILFMINIFLIFFSFFYLKYWLEKKIMNKEILSELKKEINNVIINLNDTTINNINLMEGRIKERLEKLNEILDFTDKKIHGLDKISTKKIKIINEEAKKEEEEINKVKVYSPQKIVKKQIEVAENKKRNDMALDLALKDLSLPEKIRYLRKEGFDNEEARKKLNLEIGEFQFFENMNNYNERF